MLKGLLGLLGRPDHRHRQEETGAREIVAESESAIDEMIRDRCVFVGSSTEGRPMAESVISRLKDEGLSPLAWFDFFKDTRPPLQELEHLTLRVGGAVLIATADDRAIIRGRNWHQARDNVLFEYGLFAGAIGRAKCSLLIPDRDDFRIPSDFLGVACFETYRADTMERAFATAVTALARVVATPPVPETVLSSGRRLLRLVGWVRDEALRLGKDWDADRGQEVVSDRIVAVSAFVREDIDSLGLRTEYDALEKVALDAVRAFPGNRGGVFDYDQLRRGLYHLARGVEPNRDVFIGLLQELHAMGIDPRRHHDYRPCECIDCQVRRWRYWNDWYDRNAYEPFRYYEYGLHQHSCPISWAAGAAEAAGLFEGMIRRDDALAPLKEWARSNVPRLSEAATAFERRLHETIFGPL